MTSRRERRCPLEVCITIFEAEQRSANSQSSIDVSTNSDYFSESEF